MNTDHTSELRDPSFQAFALLRTVFTVAPILFGLDKFFDILTDLKAGGVVWLLTPKVGRDGYVETSDIAEAAPVAGLSTTSTLSVTDDWSATKLVVPKSGRRG